MPGTVLHTLHLSSWGPPPALREGSDDKLYTEAQTGYITGPSHTAAEWQAAWLQSQFRCDTSMAVVQGNDSRTPQFTFHCQSLSEGTGVVCLRRNASDIPDGLGGQDGSSQEVCLPPSQCSVVALGGPAW